MGGGSVGVSWIRHVSPALSGVLGRRFVAQGTVRTFGIVLLPSRAHPTLGRGPRPRTPRGPGTRHGVCCGTIPRNRSATGSPARRTTHPSPPPPAKTAPPRPRTPGRCRFGPDAVGPRVPSRPPTRMTRISSAVMPRRASNARRSRVYSSTRLSHFKLRPSLVRSKIKSHVHVRVKRRGSSAGANPARQLWSLQPVAIGAAVEVTKPPEPWMQRVALATPRAGRP